MVSRLFVLEQLDEKKSTGVFDPRVFKGGNALYATMDPKTALWSFKMDRGLVPGALRDKFTDLGSLMRHAADYFATKSIRIKEVLHCPSKH